MVVLTKVFKFFFYMFKSCKILTALEKINNTKNGNLAGEKQA